MNILVACERSQVITTVLREHGHNAYSCDIQTCTGEHPEWHILDDCLNVINGNCIVKLQTGKEFVKFDKWDLLIAHPPCTYMSVVANRWHSTNVSYLDAINIRTMARIEAVTFFMKIVNADCDRIAVENPIGVIDTFYRQPDCIVSPYFFAKSTDDTDNYTNKRTAFWLKGLKPLQYEIVVPKPKEHYMNKYNSQYDRSKSFKGIAKAIATQWADNLPI